MGLRKLGMLAADSKQNLQGEGGGYACTYSTAGGGIRGCFGQGVNSGSSGRRLRLVPTRGDSLPCARGRNSVHGRTGDNKTGIMHNMMMRTTSMGADRPWRVLNGSDQHLIRVPLIVSDVPPYESAHERRDALLF